MCNGARCKQDSKHEHGHQNIARGGPCQLIRSLISGKTQETRRQYGYGRLPAMSNEPTTGQLLDALLDFRDAVFLRFEKIGAKLLEHDRRFDEHDRRFDEHDRRFDRLDMRLDNLDRRMGRLETRVEYLEAR